MSVNTMESIVVSYRPVKILPWKREIKVSIPTQWSDITENQALSLKRLFQKKLSEQEIVSIFSDLPQRLIRRLPGRSLSSIALKVDKMRNLEMVYDRFFIACYDDYAAPSPGMSDRRVIDFFQALQGLRLSSDAMKLKQSGETQDGKLQPGIEDGIDGIIASLYQDPDELDSYAIRLEKVNSWSRDIRSAILFNFVLIEGWLRRRFPRTFMIGEYLVDEAKTEFVDDSRIPGGKTELFSWLQLCTDVPEGNLIEEIDKKENELTKLGIEEDFDLNQLQGSLVDYIRILFAQKRIPGALHPN